MYFLRATLLILFLNSPQPALAAKSPLSAEICGKLLHVMDLDDLDYGDVQFPSQASIDFSRKDLALFFSYDFRIWQTELNRTRLEELIRKFSRGEVLTKAELLEMSQMRALFKKLRFSYVLYDEKHEYPVYLNKFTTELGKVRDAHKNNQMALARAKANSVLDLIKKDAWAKIAAEMNGFSAGSGKSFNKYLADQIFDLKKSLRTRTVTGSKFHEMRKTASRLVAFLATAKTLYPSPEREQLFEFLSTVSSRMGLLNESLIAQKFANTFDYENDPFVLPDDIRDLLQTLVTAWPNP